VTTMIPSADKHRFDDIYNLDEPDTFFHAMKKLSYRTPDYLTPSIEILRTFVDENAIGGKITILDLCCGYGLNSLLLKHDLDMEGIVDFIANPQRSAEGTLKRGRLFALGNDDTEIRIVGADIADKALRYAHSRGLIDDFVCKNLEEDALSSVEQLVISEVDIIISTGSLSYITARSIKAYLSGIDSNKPLLTLFWPLLGHDTSNVIAALAAFDMDVVDEEETFYWHREYASIHERDRFFARYERSGISYMGTLAEKGVCVTRLVAKRSGRSKLLDLPVPTYDGAMSSPTRLHSPHVG
jgi:SAM-dependent methyltransferase